MMNLKEQLAANLVSSPQLILPTKARQSTSPPCIDNGRVLLHDSPYPAGMAAPYLSRFGGLGQPVYSTSPMTPNGLTVEPSAFYPLGGMIPSLYGRSEEMWKNMEHPGLGFGSPVDHMLASAHPYGAFYGGIDLNNAARRKNATRETTSALKAWLYEHRKNPYPTKGEKIMLAIITKMTLTQVSTWFANARRRLKKESKLGYKDRDVDDSDVESIGSPCDREDEKDRNGSLSSNQLDDEDDDIDVKVTSDISDISDVESEADVLRFGESKRKFFKSASEGDNIKSEDGNQNQTSGQNIAARLSPPNGLNVDNLNRASSSNTRSRIWSIDEIISKCESSPRTETACSKNIVPSLLSNTSPRQNIPFTRIVDAPVCSSAHAQNKISSETKTSLKEPPQLFSTNSHSDVALNLAISDKRGLTHPRIETSEKTLIQAESNNSS